MRTLTDLSPQTVKAMLNDETIDPVNQTQEVGPVHAPIPENDREVVICQLERCVAPGSACRKHRAEIGRGCTSFC